MKVSAVLLGLSAASVGVAGDKIIQNARTVTITKSGWDPKATNKFGRFDHTTRIATTTVWTGKEPVYHHNEKRASSNTTGNSSNSSNSTTSSHANAGVAAGYSAGVVGAVAAAGLLLI